MRSRPRRASSENPASPRMVGLGGHWAGSIGSRRADASNRGYPGGLVIEGVTKSPAGRRLEHRALPCWRQLCAGRHVDIKLRYDVPGPQMNLSFLKICDLQQLAIPDPGLCQLSLGLGRSRGIATRLIDLEEPIVGPAGPAELGMGEVRRRLYGMHHGNVAGRLIRDETAKLLRRGNDSCSVARHLRRGKNEMDVVRVIAEPIDTHRRVGVGQVFFVDRGRDLIPNPIDQNPWAHWRSP